MTRVLGFIVHNWPLKVAALVLASLLYGVLVLARDAQEIPVAIPIQTRGLADEVTNLSSLGQVTSVRYLAEPDVTVNSQSFIAWVDISATPVGDGTRTVNVQVEAGDRRIDPISWEPRQITVTLDSIETRSVPIRVDLGEVPPGLDVRPPQLDQQTARVSGAGSVVDRVERVEATVQIEPAGIDIDRDVQLVPVDALGASIPQVDVVPSSVRVRVPIIKDGETKTVPVAPLVTGLPAPGFEVASIAVEPLIATVEGDGDQLAELAQVETEPISLNGATATVERRALIALPLGVLVVGEPEVTVTITLRPVTGTRNLTAGIRLDGALPDRPYDVAVTEILVTLGGSVADLARFEGATFELEVPVAGLPAGRHEVEVTADLPAGLTLVSASPRTVIVTVGEPPPSPTPSVAPSLSPSPVPSASP